MLRARERKCSREVTDHDHHHSHEAVTGHRDEGAPVRKIVAADLRAHEQNPGVGALGRPHSDNPPRPA